MDAVHGTGQESPAKQGNSTLVVVTTMMVMTIMTVIVIYNIYYYNIISTPIN